MTRLMLFLGVQLVLWSQVSARSPFFRKLYEYSPDQQSFYKLQKTATNWTEANSRCRIEGATLATPGNILEAEYILKSVDAKAPEVSRIYVGWQDILSEGTFTTAEGLLIDYGYQRWGEGQPDNANGAGRNCVVMDRRGLLSVESCSTILPYVCKKTLRSLEWNEACQLPDLDYKYDSTMKKCYKFHLTPKTWKDAFKICAAEESYLAVINSQAEAYLMANITEKAPKDSIGGDYLRGAVHMGFHNLFDDGWQTIFGVSIEESGYSKWGGGQPDSAGGPEPCGSIFYEGTLNDISCVAFRCFFICERDVGASSPTPDERLTNEINYY